MSDTGGTLKTSSAASSGLKHRRTEKKGMTAQGSSNDPSTITTPISSITEDMNNKTKKNESTPITKQKRSVKVYGIDLSALNDGTLFVALAAAHIICSLVFAYFQEYVTKMEGFKYPKSMSVIQLISFTLCAYLEVSLSGGELGNIRDPRAPLVNYLKMSVLTGGGMYFTNWGLLYLSYPTRIIFKAAKPLPTMVLEWCYVGKLFSVMEMMSVAVLTVGIVLFCSGEAKDSPSFHMYGIILMSVGVILDSLTSNYEKKCIFSFHSSHCEAMFFASLFGLLLSLMTLILTEWDMLCDSLLFIFIQQPLCLIWLTLSSIGAYLSVTFVLLLIKHFSTTYAECVKGMRKVLSIMLSYLLLSSNDKSFGFYHFLGMICFIFSIGLTIYNKSTKNKNTTSNNDTNKNSNNNNSGVQSNVDVSETQPFLNNSNKDQ